MKIRLYEPRDRNELHHLLIDGLSDFAKTKDEILVATEQSEKRNMLMNLLDYHSNNGWKQFNFRYWVAVIEGGGANAPSLERPLLIQTNVPSLDRPLLTEVVVGGVGLEPTQRQPTSSRRMATMHALTVSRDHRQKGIGRLLVLALEQFAASQNIETIRLTTYSFLTSAMDFYNKLGYTEDKRKVWKGVTLVKMKKKGAPSAPLKPL